MKKITYILIAATLLMASCIKKPIYNTPNPDKGTIYLTVLWNNIHIGDSAPDTYTLVYNDEEHTLTSDNNTILVDPSLDMEFLVYNHPSGITILDGIATLNEATRVAVDPEPNPSHLYYGKRIVNVYRDRYHDVIIDTKRGTAPVTIRLNYLSSEVANVQSVEVELSGVAATRDMHTDALSDEVTLTQFPTLDVAVSQLEVSYNILGTASDTQELILTFTTVDGQTRVVRSDISQHLTDFNTKMEPVVIEGDLNLPIDLEVEGDITDWRDIDEGEGEAN